VKAEATSALALDAYENAARELEKAIREHAGASADVTLLPPDSLPRTDGKTALIERK
jgi:phenylacetate-CoA ligase